MKLFRVTITGADDAVNIQDLLALSRQYPFVEWGLLLVKEDRMGTPRNPSLSWIANFFEACFDTDIMPNLSAHLCGQRARDVVTNQFLWLPPNGILFDRVQLNLRVNLMGDIDLDKLGRLQFISPGRPEFILQYHGVEKRWLNVEKISGLNPTIPVKGAIAVLFDASGGKGISPNSWQPPFYGMRCGYAGGLNPDNLEEQLTKIAFVAGDETVWIDMETGVRTDNQFDLDKVNRCLEIVKPWIS
jgi:phosphoribosylanthranilate isomerase